LQCIAVLCSALQFFAVCCAASADSIRTFVCCSVLQCVEVRRSALQCVEVRRSALQCVAVRCSVLQRVAACCSALQYFAVRLAHFSVLCCIG